MVGQPVWVWAECSWSTGWDIVRRWWSCSLRTPDDTRTRSYSVEVWSPAGQSECNYYQLWTQNTYERFWCKMKHFRSALFTKLRTFAKEMWTKAGVHFARTFSKLIMTHVSLTQSLFAFVAHNLSCNFQKKKYKQIHIAHRRGKRKPSSKYASVFTSETLMRFFFVSTK